MVAILFDSLGLFMKTSYSEIRIKVSKIFLDQKNPRFPPVGSQREAIQVMLEDLGSEISALAADIYQNGLNPSSRMIVFEEGGKYVDGDGNRRLTALKILETPSLADCVPKVRRKVDAILKEQGSVPTEVQCVVFKSRKDAKHWISVNHSGRQLGRGQIPWDSEQTERFEGRHAIGLQALDCLSKKKLIAPDDKAKINKTTLDRLLSYSDVKEKLSVKKSGSEFSFGKIDDLRRVVLALRGKKVDVVYTAQKGSDFVDSVLGGESLATPPAEEREISVAASAPKLGAAAIRTPRKSNPGLTAFGGRLSLKKGHVNNLYRDIEALYDAYRQGKIDFSDDFIVIFRMSLRMLAETAAREIGKDLKAYLLDNFDQAKSGLDKDLKTSLSSQSVERSKIVQLFQTGAHDYANSRNEEQAVALSIILGAILSLTHKKKK